MRSAIYFLSDLHLGAAYDNSSKHREKHVVRFLDSVKADAKAIYLLGDIIDYWYEYRYVVPKGFVRLLGKLAELNDEGVEIVWLTGNHDIWLFDYLPNEIGARVVDSSLLEDIDGETFYLAHGDRTGCDSFFFSLMQKLFRNRFCQWLYAAIHPRWTIPFALRWSSSSRQKPQLNASPERTSQALDRLESYCRDFLSTHPQVHHFIFGHLHVVAQRVLSPSADMTVIGDWLTHFSYARYADGKLSMHRYPLPNSDNSLPE